MKKTSLLTIVFLVFFLGTNFNANAQFGKLKSMAKTATKKKAKKETTKTDPKSSSSSSSSNSSSSSKEETAASSDKPKTDPNDMVYRNYSSARDALSSIKYNLKQKDYGRIKSELDKYQKHVTYLKENGEADKQYLKEFEAQYTDYKTTYNKIVAASALGKKLDQYTESISWFKDKLDTYYRTVGATDKTYCDKLNKEAFLATKQEINASPSKTESHQKSIEKIEAFYATDVPKVKEYTLNDMKEGTRSLEYWSAENRKTDEFLKAFQPGDRPDHTIKKLTKSISYGKEFLKLAPTDADVLGLVQKQEAGIKELTVLMDSDELKKLDVLAHQRRIDKVRISPAQLTDSKLSTIATKKTTERGYGKVLRVSITSDWFVVKNEFDLPKEKKILIETAHKAEDGKCYRVEGYLVRDYEGGGTYSSNILYQNKHQKEEMNCNNVNK